MIRPACLLAALFAAFPVVASLNEDDLLPIDEAFALTAQADATDLRLHWRIADGYYLYRHRIAVKAVTADVVLDEPVLPEGPCVDVDEGARWRTAHSKPWLKIVSPVGQAPA